MRNYLELIKHNYDHIIIDCPPSLSMLTINALAAANSVQAQYLPIKVMTQLMWTIGRVRQKQINPGLKVDGILLTLADIRTNLARTTADTLRNQYRSMLRIYKTQIPIAIKAAEISAAGQSIFVSIWPNVALPAWQSEWDSYPHASFPNQPPDKSN